MKKIILCMIWVSSYSLAVETCDYVDESIDSKEAFSIDDYYDSSRPLEDYELWKVKLDQFLIQHDDINVNVIGLAGLSEPYLNRIDKNTGLPLISDKQKQSLLNRLLDSYDVSYSSLVVAQDICQQETFGVDCPNREIQEKLIELQPENMIVYLYGLEKAVDDDDSEMVDAILERMSQAEYAQMLIQNVPSFKAILSSYLNENPVPENPDDAWFKEYEDQFNDFDMEWYQLNNLMSYYAIQKTMYMPAFRPMMIACEQYQINSKNCLNIANKLVDKSDSLLLTSLGYGLFEKIHEVNDNTKELKRAKSASENFSDYMMCVAKTQSVGEGLDMFTDPKVSELFLNSTHEGETFEKMALYLYDKHKAFGTEGLTDPKSCGLRYVKQ